MGIVSTNEAVDRARDHSLDLVELAPMAKPPVCKIMDYGKYRYKQQMKERASKKKQHVVKLKEVRFRPRIEEHDLKMKINQAKKFLEKGNKVKINIMFRGRELAHREIGNELMDRILNDLQEVGEIDKGPMNEGRFIIAFLTAK